MQAVGEQHAIGQCRQRVEMGDVFKLPLMCLQRRDVRKERDVLQHRAAPVMNGADRQHRRIDFAVPAPIPNLAVPMAFFDQILPHGGVKGRIVATGGEQARILAEHVGAGVKGDAREGFVDVEDGAIGRSDQDAFARVREDARRQPQFFLGALAIADVEQGYLQQQLVALAEGREMYLCIPKRTVRPAVMPIENDGAIAQRLLDLRSGGQRRRRAIVLFRRRYIGRRQPDHCLHIGQPIDLHGRRIAVKDTAADRVEHDHGDARIGKEQVVVGFAFGDLGFGRPQGFNLRLQFSGLRRDARLVVLQQRPHALVRQGQLNDLFDLVCNGRCRFEVKLADARTGCGQCFEWLCDAASLMAREEHGRDQHRQQAK